MGVCKQEIHIDKNCSFLQAGEVVADRGSFKKSKLLTNGLHLIDLAAGFHSITWDIVVGNGTKSCHEIGELQQDTFTRLSFRTELPTTSAGVAIVLHA